MEDRLPLRRMSHGEVCCQKFRQNKASVIGALTPRLDSQNNRTWTSMTENKSLWQVANSQAKQVAKLNNQQAKDRQVVLLCKTLKMALGKTK